MSQSARTILRLNHVFECVHGKNMVSIQPMPKGMLLLQKCQYDPVILTQISGDLMYVFDPNFLTLFELCGRAKKILEKIRCGQAGVNFQQ